MKKILLMLVILTGCIGVGWTQQAKLDSLLRVNEAYQKEDSLKVIYLRYIFGQYAILKQFDKVESFGEAAVSLAKKLPNKSILEVTYYKLGASYHGVSDYLKALSYYEKALEVGKEAADKVHMADTYLNMGALYNDIPDYAKSLEAHQNAIILYQWFGNFLSGNTPNIKALVVKPGYFSTIQV
ncbi:MAG: tetratricopeptide repeat protein [Sediminibacterium magnilacihabitans]|nr:tetratricopeptide repeat protein [Sediminibacterium magnilacihabitans]